jgi:hypothetical protein
MREGGQLVVKKMEQIMKRRSRKEEAGTGNWTFCSLNSTVVILCFTVEAIDPVASPV